MKGLAASAHPALPVKAILFDLDGTLVDASEAISGTFNLVMSRFGYDGWSRSRVTAAIGRPLADLFREVHPALPARRLQEMLKAYEVLALEEDPRAVLLKPNVRRTLVWLSEHVAMGVVTSRRGTGARRILRRFGLEAHFSVTIGIESVQRPKPDAQPLRMALDTLGVHPAQALMVGDTVDDVRSAKSAGVRSAAVTTGHQPVEVLVAAEPDYVIHDLSEMARLPELADLPTPVQK